MDPVPEESLPGLLRDADICLGIFGTSEKAGRVVPNKVVQAAAMGKAIVSRSSPALTDYFQDGKSLRECSAGCPNALAEAILELAADSTLRSKLGAEARKVFERSFSLQANAIRVGTWLRSGFSRTEPELDAIV